MSGERLQDHWSSVFFFVFFFTFSHNWEQIVLLASLLFLIVYGT